MYYRKEKDYGKYFNIIPKDKAHKAIGGLVAGIAIIGLGYFIYETIGFILELVIALAVISGIAIGAKEVHKRVSDSSMFSSTPTAASNRGLGSEASNTTLLDSLANLNPFASTN